MSIYRDLIIDHYQNPRNFGELKNPDATAREANASCGDMVEFQIKVKRVQSSEFRVQEVAWRGVGCAISTAAASLLSERVKSQESRVKSILEITDEDMVKLLGGDISHARIRCAALPLAALKAAVAKLKDQSSKIKTKSKT